MGTEPDAPQITRLYKPTYLRMIRNSVGTAMFRSFYIEDKAGNTRDALDGGENSCAFYVSSVLVLFRKLERVHGTVEKTIEDLVSSDWQTIGHNSEIKPGDVLVWVPKTDGSNSNAHIGFAVGDGRAISTSSAQKVVTEHDINFGKESRAPEKIYRMSDWG